MNNLCFNITGIANNEMKTSLKNSLGKIEGIRSVEIDKALGKVEVEFNEPANEEQIRNCIEQTGFNLNKKMTLHNM